MFEDLSEPKVEEVPLMIPHNQQATEQTPLETVDPMNANPFWVSNKGLESVPYVGALETIDSTNANPLGLSNNEIDELLQSLESVPDVFQGLDQSMIGEGSEDHTVDVELNAVLNMCVEDYIV
jgi:hypothetical protein